MMDMRKAEGQKPKADKGGAKADAAKAKEKAKDKDDRWDWDLLAQYP